MRKRIDRRQIVVLTRDDTSHGEIVGSIVAPRNDNQKRFPSVGWLEWNKNERHKRRQINGRNAIEAKFIKHFLLVIF